MSNQPQGVCSHGVEVRLPCVRCRDDDRRRMASGQYGGVDPTRRRHTDDRQCWCSPELLALCDECDRFDPDPSCWKCGGRGFVKPTPEQEADENETLVILHHDLPNATCPTTADREVTG